MKNKISITTLVNKIKNSDDSFCFKLKIQKKDIKSLYLLLFLNEVDIFTYSDRFVLHDINEDSMLPYVPNRKINFSNDIINRYYKKYVYGSLCSNDSLTKRFKEHRKVKFKNECDSFFFKSKGKLVEKFVYDYEIKITKKDKKMLKDLKKGIKKIGYQNLLKELQISKSYSLDELYISLLKLYNNRIQSDITKDEYNMVKSFFLNINYQYRKENRIDIIKPSSESLKNYNNYKNKLNKETINTFNYYNDIIEVD